MPAQQRGGGGSSARGRTQALSASAVMGPVIALGKREKARKASKAKSEKLTVAQVCADTAT